MLCQTLFLNLFDNGLSPSVSPDNIKDKSDKRYPCDNPPDNLHFKGTEIFPGNICNCPACHQKTQESDADNRNQGVHFI